MYRGLNQADRDFLRHGAFAGAFFGGLVGAATAQLSGVSVFSQVGLSVILVGACMGGGMGILLAAYLLAQVRGSASAHQHPGPGL